jgi:trehalose 6-phosphate synthase/phosphatase
MEQKPAAQEHPPAQEQAASRPPIGERADTLLPPSQIPSITQVPVTPGINFDTYQPHDDDDDDEATGTNSPGYFSREAVTSPQPNDTDLSPSEVAATAKTTENLLGRMSLAAMGRRQSLSEIRAAHPDLHLSGNVISATFNIPHTLAYNKGADWVSHVLLSALLVYPACYVSPSVHSRFS